ncbi:hypothetical protein [Gordonia sputi]
MSHNEVLCEVLDLPNDNEVDLAGLSAEIDAAGLDLTNPGHYQHITDLATCHGYHH